MIEEDQVIPPITNFKNFGFNRKFLKILQQKKYSQPTPIQA